MRPDRYLYSVEGKPKKHQGRVAPAECQSLIRLIRLVAATGKGSFTRFVQAPLIESGWERSHTNESSLRLMQSINKSLRDPSRLGTIAPLCKRMVGAALNEGPSSLGNSILFFLDRMMASAQVAGDRESREMVEILLPPLEKFQSEQERESSRLFEEGLENLSKEDFRRAFAPAGKESVDLQEIMEERAALLMDRIKGAVQQVDLQSCRTLLAAYLIRHADMENNQREEVESIIDSLEAKEAGFRRDMWDYIAVTLHYQIITGISAGELKKTVRGIRKYVHIFQGNPEIKYFEEIDHMEKQLLRI